jgi:8-oxo-dGTP pyrophosphatase MutT (NUDIX family)
MLTIRLIDDAFIPAFATHYVGVGGVVHNDKGELLVVWEKIHKESRPCYYKLPGGALVTGENITDGVIREVFEETGIQTEFKSLSAFRHWHGYRYGNSDIYFVCHLLPLSQDIIIPANEIHECLWMPVDEFYTNEYVSAHNKHFVRVDWKEKN